MYGSRSGSPTRHEPKISRACRSCSRVWIVLGGRPSSGGQTRSPSSSTVYGRTDPSSRSVEHDERVVVPLDGERPLAGVEHRNLAGDIGLDPDRCLRAARVAQERAEEEAGHRERP